MLSCRDMAPWLSIHSPTTEWGGKVVAPATKGGMHFLAHRAVVKVFLLPQGSIYTGAHKGAHHSPLNLVNPHARQGVSI